MLDPLVLNAIAGLKAGLDALPVIGALAAGPGVSPDRLERALRRETGQSAASWSRRFC